MSILNGRIKLRRNDGGVAWGKERERGRGYGESEGHRLEVGEILVKIDGDGSRRGLVDVGTGRKRESVCLSSHVATRLSPLRRIGLVAFPFPAGSDGILPNILRRHKHRQTLNGTVSYHGSGTCAIRCCAGPPPPCTSRDSGVRSACSSSTPKQQHRDLTLPVTDKDTWCGLMALRVLVFSPTYSFLMQLEEILGPQSLGV